MNPSRAWMDFTGFLPRSKNSARPGGVVPWEEKIFIHTPPPTDDTLRRRTIEPGELTIPPGYIVLTRGGILLADGPPRTPQYAQKEGKTKGGLS
jgi:hypothetical protein